MNILAFSYQEEEKIMKYERWRLSGILTKQYQKWREDREAMFESRDHGGVILLDIRDRSGLVQLVFQPENQALFALAETLRPEYVIKAKGCFKARPAGQENPNLKSGKVEIIGSNLTILSQAQTPPFPLDDQKVSEEVRLTHRTIHLRRPGFYNRSMIADSLKTWITLLQEPSFLLPWTIPTYEPFAKFLTSNYVSTMA